MSTTLESLFGPASSPVSIAEFIHAETVDQITVGLAEREENEYSVSDIQEQISSLWHNPRISGHLTRLHNATLSSLLPAYKTKTRQKHDLNQLVQLETDLQQTLDTIPLKSWNLPNEAAAFIRTSRNSDYNTRARLKTNSDSFLSNQAIIIVTVYDKVAWGGICRRSQHAVLSSQTLGDLFDVIHCPPIKCRDDTDFGCVICIEGTAYGDGHEQKDYADGLLSQLAKDSKKQTLQKATRSLRETSFDILSVRLHEPYWLLHKGNCEHFIIIDQIRLQHRSDPDSGYPLTLQETPTLVDLCRCCRKVPGVWSVKGDVRLGESPCILCAPCWRCMGEPEDSNVDVVSLLE